MNKIYPFAFALAILTASRLDASQGQSMMPMPAVAPLFVENTEVSSTATVVNAAAMTTTADIALLDQHGTQIIKESLKLLGHSQTRIEIADLLHKAHSAAWIGSVVLTPAPQSAKNMSVVAQLSLVKRDAAEPAYLEEEFLMPSSMGSNVFHAASSSVLGRPVLALMSTSMVPQTVTVTCIPERGGSHARSIQLPANEMTVIGACDTGEQPIAAFEDVWRQRNPDTKGAVGISVTGTAMPGELNVYGFVLRGDRNHPAYTALNFADAGLLHSSNTVFPGVPVGEADLLSGESFKPEIALANFSARPVTAQLLYTSTDDNGSQQKVVASVTLAPQSSTTMPLPALAGDPRMRNSFVVQSSAPPGSLAANLTAAGGALFPNVQLIGKDQQQVQNGGSHPWSLEDSATATLLLFNPTSEKHRVDVRIAANGKLWLHRYQLEASETKGIDIRAIVTSGAKGDNGQILPTDATVGEVNWSTEFAGEGFGRVLVSHPAASLARNFSCGTQYQACGSYMEDDSIETTDETSEDMGPMYVYYCLGGTTCTGQQDYSSGESSVWSSNNTPVATVPTGSLSQAAVTGHSAGTAEIGAQGSFGGCQEQSSGSATVQTPGSFSSKSVVKTYTDQVAKFCNGDPLPSNPNAPRWGTQDCITYTLLDTNKNPITAGQFTASETFTFKSGTWLDPTPFKDAPLTSGTILDEQSLFSTSGPLPSNFTEDFLQVITVTNTASGTTSTVRQNCVKWSGATVTVTDVTTNPGSCS
jgi:hypothetical protein